MFFQPSPGECGNSWTMFVAQQQTMVKEEYKATKSYVSVIDYRVSGGHQGRNII